MPLEYACILPHGSDVIPQLAVRKTEHVFEKTRESVRTIAREIRKVRPDTIVIASPHNLRLQSNIAIVTTENSTGKLKGPRKSVSLKLRCDREFAQDLLKESTRRGLPVVGANYGTAEGPASDMPMDWGTLVPMWFVAKEERVKAKTVIVTPSREIPLSQNIAFGTAVARIAERRQNRRIVFIASADQAHAHKRSGPYGYHRAAARYDKFVSQAIWKNRIDSISRLGKRVVEDAKPDSLWQMAILAGLTRIVKMRASLLSYEVPSYYGMICASFLRA